MQSIFNSRNLVIFITFVVGIIIGTSLAAYKKEPIPPPEEDEMDVVDDAVDVRVPGNPLVMPDEFKAALRNFGTAGNAGIALVNLVDDKPTLQAFSITGDPINLCGRGIDAKYGDRTCSLRIPTRRLMARLAGRATCPALCGGNDNKQHECHTTGRRANKYDCSDGSHTCTNTCG